MVSFLVYALDLAGNRHRPDREAAAGSSVVDRIKRSGKHTGDEVYRPDRPADRDGSRIYSDFQLGIYQDFVPGNGRVAATAVACGCNSTVLGTAVLGPALVVITFRATFCFSASQRDRLPSGFMRLGDVVEFWRHAYRANCLA